MWRKFAFADVWDILASFRCISRESWEIPRDDCSVLLIDRCAPIDFFAFETCGKLHRTASGKWSIVRPPESRIFSRNFETDCRHIANLLFPSVGQINFLNAGRRRHEFAITPFNLFVQYSYNVIVILKKVPTFKLCYLELIKFIFEYFSCHVLKYCLMIESHDCHEIDVIVMEKSVDVYRRFANRAGIYIWVN